VIHPAAIVHPRAQLASGVEVGAHAIVDEHVQIGAGTTIGAHAVITGHTRLGRDNRVHQFATVGTAPQYKGYKGEPTRLEVGDDNTLEQYCTLNVATAQGGGVTTVGNHNRISAYAHVAHDCHIGNHVVLSNGVQLAGHVEIGDHALLGEGTLVHQFSRIGEHVLTVRGSAVQRDIPPFITCGGNFAQPQGVNEEGLAKHGFAPAEIEQIRWAYEMLYLSRRAYADAKAEIAERGKASPHLRVLSEFLAKSVRGIIR
jgi:UDP-N-acetylglucosamine acyltransferase